jgi:hypothetical protein
LENMVWIRMLFEIRSHPWSLTGVNLPWNPQLLVSRQGMFEINSWFWRPSIPSRCQLCNKQYSIFRSRKIMIRRS